AVSRAWGPSVREALVSPCLVAGIGVRRATPHAYGNISRTRLWSAAETVVECARPRLRPGAFLVRMWLLKALALLNFPEAVFLKRFAAPRWVLSLGMGFL